jgi:hypothetical protein
MFKSNYDRIESARARCTSLNRTILGLKDKSKWCSSVVRIRLYRTMLRLSPDMPFNPMVNWDWLRSFLLLVQHRPTPYLLLIPYLPFVRVVASRLTCPPRTSYSLDIFLYTTHLTALDCILLCIF